MVQFLSKLRDEQFFQKIEIDHCFTKIQLLKFSLIGFLSLTKISEDRFVTKSENSLPFSSKIKLISSLSKFKLFEFDLNKNRSVFQLVKVDGFFFFFNQIPN